MSMSSPVSRSSGRTVGWTPPTTTVALGERCLTIPAAASVLPTSAVAQVMPTISGRSSTRAASSERSSTWAS
jgi:hypothetical protein